MSNKYQREADSAKAEAEATPQIKLSGEVTAKRANLKPSTARGLRRPTSRHLHGQKGGAYVKAKHYRLACRAEVMAGRINGANGTWRNPIDDTDRKAYGHMRAGYNLR